MQYYSHVSGVVRLGSQTLTLLFFKLCIHLIAPSRRICTAKLRVFLQLLSVGTVFHALTTDKEDNVLHLTHAFSQ